MGMTYSGADAGAVFIREYDDGRMLLEDALRPGELELVFGQTKGRRPERRNRRKRRVRYLSVLYVSNKNLVSM